MVLTSMKLSIAILALSHVGYAADEANDVCFSCVKNGGSWQVGECQVGDCPIQDVGCCRVTTREEALFQGPGYPMEWVGLGHALKCCQEDEKKQSGFDGGFGGFDSGFGGPPPAFDSDSKGGDVGSDPPVHHNHKGAHGGCRSPARGGNCNKCCRPTLNEEKVSE